MFDIGWSELLLVLMVALVVVGPKDLPRLMRVVGRWVGKARAMADQFKASFDELARESELDELRQEIAALRTNNPITRLQDEVNRSIQPPATGAVPAGEDNAEADAAPPHDAAPQEALPDDIHAEPAAPSPESHEAPLPEGGYKPGGP